MKHVFAASFVLLLVTAAFFAPGPAKARQDPDGAQPASDAVTAGSADAAAPASAERTKTPTAPPNLESAASSETGRVTASSDPRGFMDRVFNRSNWDDMKAQVTLTLTNRRGDERVRRIDLWSSRDALGSSRMLMRFVEPADVRGTAFLLIEHQDADDDRRLWLPALRRVQRIAASGVGGSFMSSDFTYYDIGRPEFSDWTFSHQGSGESSGTPCELILGTAASDRVVSDTGYATIRWCVDSSRLVVLEADYTDKHRQPLKSLRVLRLEDVAGTPFATHMAMENASTGHRSLMVFAELEIDGGIDDEVFTERSLRRGR